jgi:hypothetical protein
MSNNYFILNPGYFRNFILGANYRLWTFKDKGTIVKFIKVTRKGFNLLDIEKNSCILTHHLYSRNFVGIDKEVPENISIVKNVWVLNWIHLKETEEVVK